MNFRHVVFLFLTLSIQLAATELVYQHPLPDSRYHSPKTTIILRFEGSSTVTPDLMDIQVNGNLSGSLEGESILSTDGRTIIWKPKNFFIAGDTVSVSIDIPKTQFSYSFSFQVSNTSTNAFVALAEEQEPRVQPAEAVRMVNGVALPSDFPQFNIIQTAQTDSGFIFLNSVKYSMILYNDGTPYFYRKRLKTSKLWDFTMQNDTTLSLMEGATAKTFNQHYEQIAWFKGGHGYTTDHHEFQLTPEGHVLLIVSDSQKMDLSNLVENGKESTIVVGNHFQELDKDKNVIFEWRSWDHFDIANSSIGLTTSKIHPVHLNSIDIDYDGHYLLSARHMNQVVKINRETGQVIWRLGGKKSTLKIDDEDDLFCFQHDFRAIDDKHQYYTVFDNGNQHSPSFSRAVEYYVDTMNNRVYKVWEYRHNPDRYSNWMGSVKRLSNGNTGIGWAYLRLPKYTEVTPAGEIIYELDIANMTTIYRTHRHHWHGKSLAPYLQIESGAQAIRLIFNHFGAKDIQHYKIYAGTTAQPDSIICTSEVPYVDLTDLLNNTTWYFRVTSVDLNGVESAFSNEDSVFVKLSLPDENQIKNGDFEDGLDNWQTRKDYDSDADWDVNDLGELSVFIYQTNGNYTDVQVSQGDLGVEKGQTYKLAFDAYADQARPFEVCLMDDFETLDYSRLGLELISNRQRHYTYTFTMQETSDFNARVFFNFGVETGEVFLDNIYFAQIETSGIEQGVTASASDFQLYANYPNPFNANTTIHYTLAKTGQVELTIYNILGKSVHHVLYKNQQAGHHQYLWNADELSSGLYFCEMRAETANQYFSDRIKLMLVK